jgi:hypothetical protein
VLDIREPIAAPAVGRRACSRAARPGALARRAMTPGGVLALQRSAGNRAVARALAAPPVGSAADRPRSVARTRRPAGRRLLRAADDLVAYTGGQSGHILVFGGGSFLYACPAVSGHPGTGEWEVGAGPLPTHTYFMHPQRTNKPVTGLEPNGVCGAGGVFSGYQEIKSDDLFECVGAHYCSIPCDVGTRRTTCGSPRDCWGSQRIKIEGGVSVAIPGTRRHAERGGFFLHAGNPKDAVSSGCLKTLNEDVFDYIRTLSGPKGAGGRVPLCVGTACPDWVQSVFPGAALLSLVSNGPF